MVDRLIAELAGGRELIAQAEALEWAVDQGKWTWATHEALICACEKRAAELRAQAQAEQPAEQGEPVAHGFAPNGDGKITDALVVGHNDDPEYNIPLYRIPDRRIAALEALLRDILSEAQFPGSLVSMSNVMKERIAAALKEAVVKERDLWSSAVAKHCSMEIVQSISNELRNANENRTPT